MFSYLFAKCFDHLNIHFNFFVCLKRRSFSHFVSFDGVEAVNFSPNTLRNGNLYMQACIGFRSGETTVSETPRLCYKCGEGGHIARECRTSNNVTFCYIICNFS